MKRLIMISIVLMITSNNAVAWQDSITHRTLAEYAARSYFSKEYIEKSIHHENTFHTVVELINMGAEREDSGTFNQYLNGTARSLNHFHAPNRALVNAGLSDLVNGVSALRWSQDGQYQESKGWTDWSWRKVREHYFNHLTANTGDLSDAYLANTLVGLGYQMHLIQDMGQPNHVRNDTHIIDGKGIRGFETWASKNNDNVIILLANQPIIPSLDLKTVPYDDQSLIPVARLYDTRNYYYNQSPSFSTAQGLAEYTNANFFSEDTVFAHNRYSSLDMHYFPYPRKENTNVQDFIDNKISAESYLSEDNKMQKGIWIKNIGVDGVNHLARASATSRFWLNVFGEGKIFYSSFRLDGVCYRDYSEKLIPRAVGYSKTMLEYFYRGTLEISPPSMQSYAVTDGSKSPQQFTTISAKVKNSTPDEKVGTGIIQAVAKYKIIPNYDKDMVNYPSASTVMASIPYSYAVSAPITLAPDPSTGFSLETPTEFTFDFSGSPIPVGITDLTFQAVVKGTLGKEENIAVAVGIKDLSEPTHQTIWNLTDMYSLQYNLYTAEQIRSNPDLAKQVNLSEIDPYDVTFTIGYTADPVATTISYPVVNRLLGYGRHFRLIGLFDRVVPSYLVAKCQEIDPDGISSDMVQPAIYQGEGDAWQSSPLETFRHWTENGSSREFIENYSVGVLNCTPVMIENGLTYCYYPDEQAIAAPKDPVSFNP